MFDDLQKTTPQNGGQNNFPSSSTPPSSPNNNPFEAQRKTVEDMFAETEADNTPSAPLRQPIAPAPKVLSDKPEIFQPKQPESAVSDPLKEKEEEAKHNMKKIIMLSSFALALLAIIGGSWFVYAKFFKKGEEAKSLVENQENTSKEEPIKDTNQNNNTAQPVNGTPDTNISPNEQPTPPAENTPSATTDTDGDGLTDEEEKQLGTNESQTDTDNDGLFDRQEVKVYKTDPKNPDTDGDGYSDGDEVKSGYNPLGAGKLLPPLPQ